MMLPLAAVVSSALLYVGSTPGGGWLAGALGIPEQAELLEWNLSLGADSRYELAVHYGMTVPNQSGIGRDKLTLRREGTYKARSGGGYELVGLLTFAEPAPGLLHPLDSEGRLLRGNGGWSYTLSRADKAERRDASLMNLAPSVSYTLEPLASGPDVHGVFEGRTPCQGIARQLAIAVEPACFKSKWRVTLFQDRYRVEGSLFRRGAGVGTWTRTGSVLRLAPKGGGSAWHLLEASPDVLLFLDATGNPLIGSAEFAYSLDRRAPPQPPVSRR